MGSALSRTQPQGAEGVATVKISTNDGTTRTLTGFIVKNNPNLTLFIDPKHSYLEKYKKTEYFVHILATVPQSEPSDTAEITVYTSQPAPSTTSTPSVKAETIYCKVDQLGEKIASVGAHQFIPCESDVFNKNSFLKKYAKTVQGRNDPGSSEWLAKTRFYGLCNGNDDTGLVLLELKKESSTSCFEVTDKAFDELTDGPLLLEDKTLAGCLQKYESDEKIKLHFFEKKEAIDVWKTSKATESDDSVTASCEIPAAQGVSRVPVIKNAGKGTNCSNGHSSDVKNKNDNNDVDGEVNVDGNGEGSDDTIVGENSGVSGGHEPFVNLHQDEHVQISSEEDNNNELEKEASANDEIPENLNGRDDSSSHGDGANGDEKNDSHEPLQVEDEPKKTPMERSMSYPSGNCPIQENDNDAEKHKKAVEGLKKVKFCEMYEHDCSVVQDLGKILDKKHSNLRHSSSLADKLGAHPLIKAKLESNYNHSPCSELFDLPAVAKRPIQDLVTALKSCEKQAIVSFIEEKYDEETDPDTKSIEDFFEEHFELKEEVTAKLEGCDDSFDWRWLGKKLEVYNDLLEKIERGTNPVEKFLVDYAYHAIPREKLQLKQFLDDMTSLGRREETLMLFERFGIKKDNYYTSTIKKEFKPDTDKMEELCKLLNKNNCKGWKHLAALWGVEESTYYFYIPDTKASPTKILLVDWLMMQRPDFTVISLAKICRELSRNDASEILAGKLEQYYKTCVDSSATFSLFSVLALIV